MPRVKMEKKYPKRIGLSITEELYDELEVARRKQCASVAEICRERLSRDSLINELRAVIREELKK